MGRRTVIITGAAGFLGSHIAQYYLDRYWRVFGADDHSSSMGVDSPHWKRLKSYPDFVDACGDIAEFDKATIEWIRPDVVVNMACPASPPRYSSMPVHTMRTCTTGLCNLLDAVAKAKWHGKDPVIVHASTSEVYGDPTVSPQPESYWGNVEPYCARSAYDEGKRAGEAICHMYRERIGLDVRVMRIFNTYGPHMDPNDGRVVTNVIKQFMTDADVTVYGDGEQTRSFCYVDDLLTGIVALADPGLTGFHGPVNLGNPSEFTINQLVSECRTMFPDSRSRIVGMPLPSNDPRVRKPDISLAKEKLGFDPKVDLSDGLRRTAEYMGTVTSWFDREWRCNRK